MPKSCAQIIFKILSKTLDKAILKCYIIYAMRKQERARRASQESFLKIVERLIAKGLSINVAEKLAFDIRLGLRASI